MCPTQLSYVNTTPSASTALSNNYILNKILIKQQQTHPACQLVVELPASQDIISTTANNLAYNVMHLA